MSNSRRFLPYYKYLIAFFKEKFGDVGAILARDTGDEGCLHFDSIAF